MRKDGPDDAAWLGLVHMLDRDLTTVCGNLFGFVSGSWRLTTCLSCLTRAAEVGIRGEGQSEPEH